MPLQSKLFHVSPKTNRASITKSGVDPIWSRGKSQCSWWVDQRKLAWAIAHCSAHHGVPADQLEVWYRDGNTARNMKRSRWAGVYWTTCRNMTEGVYSIELALSLLVDDQVL